MTCIIAISSFAIMGPLTNKTTVRADATTGSDFFLRCNWSSEEEKVKKVPCKNDFCRNAKSAKTGAEQFIESFFQQSSKEFKGQ